MSAQEQLMAEVARLRARLDAHAAGTEAPEPEASEMPPPLAALTAAFGLSPFERDVLMLCAAGELDGGFGAAIAAAHGRPDATVPTFGLALAVLPDAHWSALTPAAPLRYWRMLEPQGEGLTSAWLRIDEAVLHYLAGLTVLDAALEGLVEAVEPPAELPASQSAVSDRLAALWAGPGAAVAHVAGRDRDGRRAVAAAAAAAHGLSLWALRGADVPLAAAERGLLARRWQRQAVLGGAALLVEVDDADAPEARAAQAFAERAGRAVALAGREAPPADRPAVRLEVPMPPAAEQAQLWRRALAPAELNGALDRVLEQFDLGDGEIRAAAGDARGRAAAGTPLREALWDAARERSRPRLDDLAQRIEPSGRWDDLVLPEQERDTLRELLSHVRHRVLVTDRWGFAGQSGRGLGVSALFAGPSGTGKTMAAELLASELELDLYRIDLSAVVSKYIGETEKNLRRVFDAADQGGALLLFDEADALFGKRTEVKDSHDRYANIEVGYLLQRMEAYRGLAVLTTNLKSALDPSFLRRLRFVVSFPRPDEPARRTLWTGAFPEDTPVGELDIEALARLDATGGTIRNIALRAAFLAADAGTPVSMEQLARAARAEGAKLERPPSAAEIGGWT